MTWDLRNRVNIYFLLSVHALAETSLLFPENVQKILQSTVQEDFVGIIHLVQNDSVLFSFAKGETVSGGLINTHSFLPITSLTSHLVSLGIIDALEKENISLDTPIQRFFSSLSDTSLSKEGQFCTVRRLLSHRCGIPTVVPGQQEDEDVFFSALNHVRIKEKPGTTHRYSLAGDELSMMLLKHLYRDVEDKQDVFHRYVHDCAVYEEIRFREKEQQMQSVFYTPFGFGYSSDWFHIPQDSYLSLHNHMVSSAEGLHCWLNIARKNGVFSKLKAQENELYGLGIAHEQRSYGTILWHSAQIPLQMTSFWAIVPESQLQVVILSPQANAPYSITQMGHMIVDELHNAEYDTIFYTTTFLGKFQASLPAIFPLFAAFAPILVAFILLFRSPTPRVPFALRIQFCFFSTLFVRQATPFALIPIGEWSLNLLVMALILKKGLQDRKNEPLFYEQQSFGMVVEYIIYGVLMVTWLPRASNTIPLFLCFFLMVLMVSLIRGVEKEDSEFLSSEP